MTKPRRLIDPQIMSLRGAQRRSNLNPCKGRLPRFARNDISGQSADDPFFMYGVPCGELFLPAVV
jgi:hypothetical protein